MKILKTFKLYENYEIVLVDTGERYEICINGKLKAFEYDYDRACETFESFKK